MIFLSSSLEKEQTDVARVSQESSQKVLELQRKIQTAREQVRQTDRQAYIRCQKIRKDYRMLGVSVFVSFLLFLFC